MGIAEIALALLTAAPQLIALGEKGMEIFNAGKAGLKKVADGGGKLKPEDRAFFMDLLDRQSALLATL